MLKQFRITIFTLLLFTVFNVRGEVKLSNIFSEGMVLQRDTPVKIWGDAEAAEIVKVSIAGKSVQTVADNNGKWEIELPSMKPGGPFTMTVNNITLENVLIGDVWLCSGQSNMETTVSRVMDMFADEINDYENQNIRHVKITSASSFHGPKEDISRSTWKVLTGNDIKDYSALCYFFAKRLYETTGVPIGLINSSVGGSSIEQWMSAQTLESYPSIYNVLGIIRSDEYMQTAAKADQMRSELWRETLDNTDKGIQGGWMKADTDDSGWEAIDMFSPVWQRDRNYQAINGSIWFRKTFTLDQLDPAKDAVLRLGCIIDADYTYVNGKQVGSTSYQYPPRIYTIPAGLLKKGENVVTIRIISNSGRPKFVEDKPYKIVQQEKEISLLGEWKYKRGTIMPASSNGFYTGGTPTGRYNAMLAPLFGYAVKGAIWYQGESNTGKWQQYEELLPLMMEEWRDGFNQSEMPFFIVQLPNYMEEKPEPSTGGWASMREVQTKTVQNDANAALIVAIDVGEWNDIHPLDKKTIGDRLSLAARKHVYGEKIVASGPVYKSFEIDGDKIIISFEKDGGSLEKSKQLKGFAVAGDDRKFVWADAWTDGNKVVVRSDKVAMPRSVRYGWADNPGAIDLRNTEGLPASPFRTDVF